MSIGPGEVLVYIWRYIMEEFDVNRDGVISKSEFKLAMRGLIKK